MKNSFVWTVLCYAVIVLTYLLAVKCQMSEEDRRKEWERQAQLSPEQRLEEWALDNEEYQQELEQVFEDAALDIQKEFREIDTLQDDLKEDMDCYTNQENC